MRCAHFGDGLMDVREDGSDDLILEVRDGDQVVAMLRNISGVYRAARRRIWVGFLAIIAVKKSSQHSCGSSGQ